MDIGKKNGYFFLFLTLLAAAIGLFGALFIYLPANPSFSMLSNYISDLSAGPLPAKILFGIGMGLGGLFLILSVIYITNNLKQQDKGKNLVQLYSFTGIIGGLGLIVIGIFPLDPAINLAYEIHRISALFFFGFTAISFFCFGYIEYKYTEFSKVLSIISLLTGILMGIFIIGFVIQEYSVVPRQSLIYLTEWGFFGVITIWLITHGLAFRKKW